MFPVIQNFSDRLKWVIERSGKNPNQFAQLVGCTRGYISKLLKGTSKNPSLEFFEKISAACGVNPTWLQKGEGDPVVSQESLKETPIVSGAPLAISKECTEYFQEFVDSCRGDTAKLHWTLIELREKFPLDKWKKT